MNRINIRILQDLEALPKAGLRSSYLSEKSLGSGDVKLAVLRVIATLEQDAREGVNPEKPEELPRLLKAALDGLDAEQLDLWGVIVEPGVAPVAMHFQWGLTKVLDATLVTIAFVIKPKIGEYLEWFSNDRDVTEFVACSLCFRRSGRRVDIAYEFNHYSTNPDVDAGAFRLSGKPPTYALQMRQGTSYDWRLPWLAAGDGLVRCRECRKIYDLRTGKEAEP